MRTPLKILALAAGVSLAAVSVGLAADLGARPVYKAPPVPPAPVFSWTGFYIGGHVGYGWGKNDWTDPAGFALAGPGATFGNDTDGFLGGGQAGFDWQFHPNWVLGVEAQGSWTNIDGSSTVGIAPDTTTFSNDVNWIVSLTGRLGYTAGNWLLYAKGGGAWADFDHTLAIPGSSATISDTLTGWTVGAGLEYAFAPNVSAKFEYQYYDFGSSNYDFALPGVVGTVPAEIDSNIHTVKVGLNWRFGGVGGMGF